MARTPEKSTTRSFSVGLARRSAEASSLVNLRRELRVDYKSHRAQAMNVSTACEGGRDMYTIKHDR
ncbi:hypothetical protein BDY19DRAFT_932493, partial [Irpex rosettiformis]